MQDIWAFLLQTLTVSGVAVLVLVIKALFRDKLPPRWQFAVWSVLGLAALAPAGAFGRYTLFRWQVLVEIIKSFFGEYGYTKVWFPFPIITAMPQTVAEWLFAAYALGVLVSLALYFIAYVRLKRTLRFCAPLCGERLRHIETLASEKGVKLRGVMEAAELPSAFVCGVLHPVLVIPAEQDTDDKIILHELFHLKNKDTLWSVIICALRCLHWCNPFLSYCAKRALNDMESRCDQYVLESLAGEERREYGRILLSMANDRFSKTPGSTCINNGGRNIRERIENIARFKKYPQGMRLVSVCVIILLAFPILLGAEANAASELGASVSLNLASARSVPCTTAAGAFDAYGKAILDRNGYFRAMCAPEAMQEEIYREMAEKAEAGIVPAWECGLNVWAYLKSGYYVYNMKQVEKDAYEALFVVELNYPPNGAAQQANMMYLAVQNLRVEKENGRWVAVPLEEFRFVETLKQSLAWGCAGLPGITYSSEASDMRMEVTYQTIHTVDNTVTNQNDSWLFSGTYYDTTPKPGTEFTNAVRAQFLKCVYIGSEENKDNITCVGLSVAAVYEGEKRPNDLYVPSGDHGDYVVSNSNTGGEWASVKLKSGWDSTINMSGACSSTDPKKDIIYPEYFAADLYINNEKVASADLILQREAQKDE